ncbi:aminotransferase class III-fold pyridoxal phosphate-dependent enzyme [Gammaproteobacteria bacterium]|nr:aminotransferase class III-fold pyridoxal phosphate-dependent enzyme [Gammaproteobacteria bacterium]
MNTSDIIHHHQNHYVQSWSVQNSQPLVVAGAQGSWFWDSSGKRYLDFQSQLVNANLGHQHPDIIAAIKAQADTLCYIGPGMGNDARSELAGMMRDVTPGDLERTFFTTGGALANENAVRLARHYTGRSKVIARYRSYHGATRGTLGLTGEPRHWLEPGSDSGIVRILDPYTYRCPAGHPSPCPVCSGAPHIEEILMYENPNSVAAIIMETVVGTNGIIVPPDGYMQSVRQLCDKYGILLILDEVMAGFGRTGKMFACEHWDVVPDILTSAKGINSGYVPLGAMTINRALSKWLTCNQFPGGLTYAGHPLACASGVATLKVYERDNIVDLAAKNGEQMMSLLQRIAEKHPSVGQVRGLGMFCAIELVKNQESREPLVPYNAKGETAKPMTEMMRYAMDQGLYLSSAHNIIRVTPPLNISEDDIKLGCEIIDRTLEIADQYL